VFPVTSASASTTPPSSSSRAVTPLPPSPLVNKLPIAECDAGSLDCCSEESYEHLREMAKNRTPPECRAIEALGSYIDDCSSSFARSVHGVIVDCMKWAMDRELDRRLLVLKAADPAQFRHEMDLQAAYLRGVKATCRVEEEPRVSDFSDFFACIVDLYERRAKEAALINDRRLKVGAPRHPVEKQADFEAYAKGLCAMPADVWEQGRPPPACVESVLKVVP
jgi:hypothetical protein